MTSNIIWFKKNLRFHDNQLLLNLNKPSLLIYIIEPDLWIQKDMSIRQWDFIEESLESLNIEFKNHNLHLNIFFGEAINVFKEITNRFSNCKIISEQETGINWTYQRDRKLQLFFKSKGIKWEQYPQIGVKRGNHDRDNWAKNFQNEINTVSSILENEQYYAVFKVDSIIKPGHRPFEEVKNQLLSKSRKKLEKDATLQKANTLLIEITADEKSLTEAEVGDKINIIENETKTISQGFSSIGRSNYVSGALLSRSTGEIIGPLETQRGHALIEILEISKFDSTEYEVQKETLRKNLFSQKQRQLFESWLSELKDQAVITDNRKFYY